MMGENHGMVEGWNDEFIGFVAFVGLELVDWLMG